MANAGFGSLTLLKKLVLPETLRSKTTWDAQLTQMGLGVVAAFERHCNRLFARGTGLLYYRDAACRTVSVPTFPIESVTSIGLRLALESAYTTQADIVANVDNGAGLIYLTQVLGGSQDQLKITYAGGLWWDTTENDSGSLPAGATAVPADLISAWAAQVQHQVEASDMLKLVSVNAKPATGSLELLGLVKDMLMQHIRFS